MNDKKYSQYRNANDSLDIVQISEKEIANPWRHLKPEDMGKWCFDLGGLFYGFFDSKEECQDRVNQVLSD
jgi:hypothetical protein